MRQRSHLGTPPVEDITFKGCDGSVANLPNVIDTIFIGRRESIGAQQARRAYGYLVGVAVPSTRPGGIIGHKANVYCTFLIKGMGQH